LRDRGQESSKKSKKRRVSQKGGSCLTSTEVIQQFEEEAAEKEREINEKLDAKAKKEETKLKKQELTQVRKINKSRKQCHLCQSMQNTDKDKARWVTCFNCSRWCCYKCLPQMFKGASVKSCYKCKDCNNEQ